jgi:RNA ligase
MKIDLEKFNKLAEEGWLKVQSHPSLPLLIWNYSEHTQFEKFWTKEIVMCRGLITDTEGNVQQKPFVKFLLETCPEAIDKEKVARRIEEMGK